MAIQWADDFSRYGLGASSRTAMLQGLPYSNLGSGVVENSPDPNDSGRAYHIVALNNDWPRDMRISLPTVVSATVGVGFRAWIGALPVAENARPALVGLQRANGDYIVYVRIEQNGAIQIIGRVGTVLTSVYNSVNPVVTPSSFNHYELIHDKAAGTGSLYINGVQRATYTGVDTLDNVVFVNFSHRTGTDPSTDVWLKDLVIWDSTGSQNNSVMGTVIVRRLKPNGDSSLGGWTPNTGTTGFNLLGKDAPNDSTYLSGGSSPLPSPASFTLENLPPDITSVRGLLSIVRAKKVDGGDANLQVGLSPNGTNWDDGADRPITSAFTYFFDVSELDPATGLPWTPLGVDSALVRINRTV